MEVKPTYRIQGNAVNLKNPVLFPPGQFGDDHQEPISQKRLIAPGCPA